MIIMDGLWRRRLWCEPVRVWWSVHESHGDEFTLRMCIEEVFGQAYGQAVIVGGDEGILGFWSGSDGETEGAPGEHLGGEVAMIVESLSAKVGEHGV